ncbi:serine hydrolase domain-containing protein [Moheibacter sediminis]|uniref:CubicO group peptidase, beta-lactamase class C family n=1 Tax=Moheibacter sediminis TaxID=1434700 RepID=A0A1W2BWR8_9FLAO|nr:serine hydrolase domain-containing protein [Moheibacter sediminis]SMC77052.1 CubicO group peptidase, beta-lactamase class C family [Moheibacter sediminis]
MKNSVVLLFLLFVISCAKNHQSMGKVNSPKKDSLDLALDSIYQQKSFAGFGVAIVDENGVLYENGFGFADISNGKKYTPHAIQNIASVSKLFVGIAVVKAQELGKLNLDDAIGKYLPFEVVNPNFPDEKITIRHLVTHTSSIGDNEFYLSKNYFVKPGQNLDGLKTVIDEEQILNTEEAKASMESFLKDMLTADGKWYNEHSFLQHKPGEIYEYSNMATTLAAFIVEHATGKSFDEFTKEYILDPLKMNDSGWKFEQINYQNFSTLYENPMTPVAHYDMITYPDGGFITSVHDLGKFLSELIKGYNGKGRILSKKGYDIYFEPQLNADNFIDRNERNPYSEAYNVGVFAGYSYMGNIGHTGGDPGVTSIMFFNPEENIGRILLVNTNVTDKAGMDAFYGIMDLLGKFK